MNEGLRSTGGRLRAFSPSGRRLIAAAALLHVALAAVLFSAGRAQLAPRLLDRDGIMESFAFDSYEYRREAVRLTGILKEDGLGAWAAEPERAHVKLLSIQFALFAPLFGHSILSAEPFNLLCYVSILSLVLMLGREVGGSRVGLVAAGVVALWPTFLLHTTQFLKDPLFIAAALALILITTTWLTRTYTWAAAVGMGALLAATSGLLLLVRARFGALVFAIAFVGFVLLVVRQLLERRLLYWNLVCPSLMLIVGALAAFQLGAGGEKIKRYPSDQSGQRKSDAGDARQFHTVISYASHAPLNAKTTPSDAGRLSELADAVALRIGGERNRFNASYPESGSTIDRDVEVTTFRELILYLPRAVAIGLWSPFPRTWTGAGKRVGSAGRLLAGAETFIMYLCELLALAAVWRGPRRLPSWLLLTISALGATALGLVVSNVGTLYRVRYLFWILLIILGVKGFAGVAKMLRARAQGSPGRAGASVASAGGHLAK